MAFKAAELEVTLVAELVVTVGGVVSGGITTAPGGGNFHEP